MISFLQSERILLRPILKDDLPVLLRFFNDPEIRPLIGEVFPTSEAEIESHYSSCQKSENRIFFIVEDRDTNEIIGEAGLLRIFYPWHTSDLSIVIYNKAYWNKGIGSEIASLLMDFAYNQLGLHRLSIGVVSSNTQALSFWKKVGFIEEGKQIDGYYCNGKYSDFIMMYQLDEDFRKLKRQ